MLLARLLLVSLCVATVMGNTCTKAQEGTLSVTGAGSTEAQPDVAKVFLSVKSTKPQATDAREEAATVATAVVEAIAAVQGVSRDDITTLDVSVQPEVQYNPSGTSKITGYTFVQRLQAKVLNLTNDVLGAVIDAAVQAGGNNVNIDSIQAELSPGLQKEATNTARVEAVDNALLAAGVLAKAGGVTLGSIKTFADSGASIPSPYTSMPASYAKNSAGGAAMESTPVNVGSTDVTASVTMTFAICNA